MTEISRFGFGTWSHGGRAYGVVSEADAQEAIKMGLAHGIRTFDTADIYGDGRAEKILGAALCDAPEIRVITKVGYLSEVGSNQDFSAKYLQIALHKSLFRLSRSCIDVFLLHSPPRSALIDCEVLETLRQFQRQGRIKEWGVSLRSFEHIDDVLKLEDCRYVEVVFNLLDQRPLDSSFFSETSRAGIKVIARVPLCFGLLGEKYDVGHRFQAPDQRARWPQRQIDRWIEAAKAFRFLVNEHRSMSQAAIAFCFSVPEIHLVIPGMKTPDQVLHNVQAVNPAAGLSPEEFALARQVWHDVGAVFPS